MRIGNENGKSKDLIVMQKDLLAERAAFWDDLKAHYPSTYTTSTPKTLMKGEL
jgi:hypothetical protein